MSYDPNGHEFALMRTRRPVHVNNFAPATTPYVAARLGSLGRTPTHQDMVNEETRQILARRAQGGVSREVLTTSHIVNNKAVHFYPYKHIY